MKTKAAFYLPVLAISLIFSCSQGENKSSAMTDSLTSAMDTTGNKTCLLAIDEKDTATLTLQETSAGKVKGRLLISYHDKAKNDGEISGAYKGDTLFVDYTFKIGEANKTIYKNPLAFLKKDKQLLLGVGQIETTLGRSYFVKGKPISFDKGRFIFATVDCK